MTTYSYKVTLGDSEMCYLDNLIEHVLADPNAELKLKGDARRLRRAFREADAVMTSTSSFCVPEEGSLDLLPEEIRNVLQTPDPG